jgi:hypothetical protein
MTMSMIRYDGARHPRGERIGTGAGFGIVDLESSLNAVLTSMRPVRHFSTASKAFATKRFADTGRLSAGSRMTTTRARDGNETAQSSS